MSESAQGWWAIQWGGEVLSTCAVVGGGGWARVVMRQQGGTRECRRGQQGMGEGTRGWGEARCVIVLSEGGQRRWVRLPLLVLSRGEGDGIQWQR